MLKSGFGGTVRNSSNDTTLGSRNNRVSTNEGEERFELVMLQVTEDDSLVFNNNYFDQ